METVTKVSAPELERRRRNVESVLGSLRIEGLAITSAATALTEQYLRGEIELSELSRRIGELPI